MNRPFHVVVLGGGISGLAAAHKIISSSCKTSILVSLLEASSRFGGWVNTVQYPDGCTFELGPRTLRPVGMAGKCSLKIVSELGLEDEVIPVTSKHPSATKRYIYAKGKIHLLPNQLVSLFTAQPPLSRSLMSSIIKEPFMSKSNDSDETIYDFISRRVGIEIADYYVDSFCHGIYASSAKELSVSTCFPSLVKYEKEFGSLVLGYFFSKDEKIPSEDCPLFAESQKEKWRMWGLKNGLQGLTDKLFSHLNKRGLISKLETPCSRLTFAENKKVLCDTANGIIEADHVISSISSTALANLLEVKQQKLKGYLNQIKSVTMAVVNVEFKGKLLPINGFGLLIPSCESLETLGVIFDSCVFDQGRDCTKLTVLMGGSRFEEFFGNPDDVDEDFLQHTALKRIGKTLNINVPPSKCLVTIQKNCIPQYRVGHLELVRSIQETITEEGIPLTVVGSSYKAVGMNDCIYNAQTDVANMMEAYGLT